MRCVINHFAPGLKKNGVEALVNYYHIVVMNAIPFLYGTNLSRVMIIAYR